MHHFVSNIELLIRIEIVYNGTHFLIFKRSNQNVYKPLQKIIEKNITLHPYMHVINKRSIDLKLWIMVSGAGNKLIS